MAKTRDKRGREDKKKKKPKKAAPGELASNIVPLRHHVVTEAPPARPSE
jgi:hypothetical protein